MISAVPDLGDRAVARDSSNGIWRSGCSFLDHEESFVRGDVVALLANIAPGGEAPWLRAQSQQRRGVATENRDPVRITQTGCF